MTGQEAWWAKGMTLAERLTGHQPAVSANRAAQDWQVDYDSAEAFRVRLAERGLDADTLQALRGESPSSLGSRFERPAWAVTVEQAIAAAPTDPSAPVAGLSWHRGFAQVLAPFVENAAEQVVARGEQAEVTAVADLTALRVCFTEQLSSTLVALSRRTLVLELNVRRVTGALVGDSPEQRFADFVRFASARSGLSALLAEYPVLARLLAQASDHAAEAWSQLLVRLADDQESVVAQLLGDADPGRLVEVIASGDGHQRGRTVALLRFEHGARVVLKPRPLEVHGHFNDCVRWLNQHLPGPDLRTLAVLERPGYGWVEYADPAPCANREQVAWFYWRLGALLALIHILGGTDMHVENLIACADQPLLVDLETLFHPVLARSAGNDPAQAFLESSVLRTALLPYFLLGEHGALDLSALGGDRDAPLPVEVSGWAAPATDEMRLVRITGTFHGAANRPRLADTDADPVAHTDSLLSGFRAGYHVIAAHSEEFTGPGGLLARFAEDCTRAVVRDTQRYATLLDESTHPDVLRDALDRDRLLDVLWRESGDVPALRRLVGAELCELWAGDIPLVTCSPRGADLSLGPLTVSGLVTEPGLVGAERRIAAMGETDLFDQEWVIRATLATRSPDTNARPASVQSSPPGVPAPLGPPATTVPDTERLLAAACGIGDQILAAAQDDGHRVNWLGLEPLDDRVWAVMPQGAGLPHGYCGTALFLAQLADLTGSRRYASVALRALTPVPGLLAALADRPADLPTIGAGFAGLGGIAYALGLLAGLLDDREIADWAGIAVELAGAAAGEDPHPGVLEGDAGCLAAMLAVQRATGVARAAAVARDCAERLAARTPEQLPSGGFSTGAGGVGWALLRFAAATGEPRHAAAGLAALRAAVAGHSTAATETGRWDGPSGTALALADSGAWAEDPELAAFLDRALDATAAEQAGDHSLCHGETGVIELLLAAAATGRVEPDAALPRAGALLATLDRLGPRCGTPDGVSSPGLLTGLAGIGHGLLRLASGDRVPSALMLAPPS